MASLKNRLEESLVSIEKWLRANSLKMNPSKTFSLLSIWQPVKENASFFLWNGWPHIHAIEKHQDPGRHRSLTWESPVSLVVRRCTGILVSLYRLNRNETRSIFKASILHPTCKENFVTTIAWPKMTPEWRHVRAIWIQNNGLQESLSWTQCLGFNRFLCMEWRRIDMPIELPSQIFKILKTKENNLTFSKTHFSCFFFLGFLKKRTICYRTH